MFRARVVKPGRTLTFCQAAFAQHQGVETLVASMTSTLMTIMSQV